MKTDTLLDGSTAQALALAWLTEAVAPISAQGERVFRELRPFAPGEEQTARARAQEIGDLAARCDLERFDAARDILRTAPDIAAAIARTSMDDVLDDAHFFELQRFCEAAARIDALFAGIGSVPPIVNAAVQAVRRALEPGATRYAGFYLADSFDEHLREARVRAAAMQAEFESARGRLIARIADALERDDITGDEFIVMRADLRGSIPGGIRIQREAPTYLLCTLEYDDATLRALERRDASADTVAVAEEAVRAVLSSLVRSHGDQLDAAAVAMGEFDVSIAAARFALRYDCSVPQIADRAVFACDGARFLPLVAELERQGRAFTPIDVELHDVAVLTGPNMGGKSITLRTCGFIALCVAFGLPTPARSAHIGLFREIAWLGIGIDDDSLGGLLSSFAKEVVRLRDLLERQSHPLFVLADEFARTTTPHEGKALLVALVERLRASSACGLIATHLAGVAQEAGVRHFAVRGLRDIPRRRPAADLHEALAALAASMDYSIAEVRDADAAGSDAIALAALLGLDERFIAAAEKSAGWFR